MPRPHLRVEVRRNVLVNASLLAWLALAIITVTSLYINSERNFHWWIDWYLATHRIASTFRESPIEGLHLIGESLIEERNRLYTIPLIPFILVFGNSRLVYQLSLALVYLLPFTLVMGAIATQLIRTHQRTVFWATAFLTLLLPVSWIPTFMGIPDTGGALFIGLAMWIYLQDVRLRRWWRIPVIGILIGCSILLRRHFVYGGITLFGALIVQALLFFAVEVRKRRQMAWWNLLEFGVRIGLIATTTFATLSVVAPEFTHRAMTLNYGAYYASWTLPYTDIFNLYTAFYGWGTWLLVGVGLATAMFTRTLAVSEMTFVGVAGVFSLLIWLVILRYGNIFYSLHVTPFVVLGLVALIYTIWSRLPGKRTLLLGVVTSYLVINFVFGLTPIGQFDNVVRPLFAISNPPLVRTDYDEVVGLIEYLRQLAANQEPIYIVGYQRLHLDTSLLRSTERLLYGQQGKILNILQASLVDSRDSYPLPALLQAKYVVVPNRIPPYPHPVTEAPTVGEWLPDQEVGVVNTVFKAFTQNWEFAQDFKRLPVQFTLHDGAVVSIYQRIRPTSVKTAVRTLYAMQQDIGEQSPGQLNWLVVRQVLKNSYAYRYGESSYRLVTFRRERDRLRTVGLDHSQIGGISFLYLGQMSKTIEVTGQVTYLGEPCAKASLRVSLLDNDGQMISATQHEYSAQNSSRFRLPLQGEKATYLLVDAKTYNHNNVVDSCTLEIQPIAVLPKQ